jgi:hypothetical protein
LRGSPAKGSHDMDSLYNSGMEQDQDWREWRLIDGELTWRAMVPEDDDRSDFWAMMEKMNARFGPQDRPDFLKSPVILTLVAEDAAGWIVDGVYIELVADITKLSTNRAGYASYEKLLPVIQGFLAERGIRLATMAVLTRWAPVMQASLEKMGFGLVDSKYCSWIRRVVP